MLNKNNNFFKKKSSNMLGESEKKMPMKMPSVRLNESPSIGIAYIAYPYANVVHLSNQHNNIERDENFLANVHSASDINSLSDWGSDTSENDSLSASNEIAERERPNVDTNQANMPSPRSDSSDSNDNQGYRLECVYNPETQTYELDWVYYPEYEQESPSFTDQRNYDHNDIWYQEGDASLSFNGNQFSTVYSNESSNVFSNELSDQVVYESITEENNVTVTESIPMGAEGDPCSSNSTKEIFPHDFFKLRDLLNPGEGNSNGMTNQNEDDLPKPTCDSTFDFGNIYNNAVNSFVQNQQKQGGYDPVVNTTNYDDGRTVVTLNDGSVFTFDGVGGLHQTNNTRSISNASNTDTINNNASSVIGSGSNLSTIGEDEIDVTNYGDVYDHQDTSTSTNLTNHFNDQTVNTFDGNTDNPKGSHDMFTTNEMISVDYFNHLIRKNKTRETNQGIGTDTVPETVPPDAYVSKLIKKLDSECSDTDSDEPDLELMAQCIKNNTEARKNGQVFDENSKVSASECLESKEALRSSTESIKASHDIGENVTSLAKIVSQPPGNYHQHPGIYHAVAKTQEVTIPVLKELRKRRSTELMKSLAQQVDNKGGIFSSRGIGENITSLTKKLNNLDDHKGIHHVVARTQAVCKKVLEEHNMALPPPPHPNEKITLYKPNSLLTPGSGDQLIENIRSQMVDSHVDIALILDYSSLFTSSIF